MEIVEQESRTVAWFEIAVAGGRLDGVLGVPETMRCFLGQ